MGEFEGFDAAAIRFLQTLGGEGPDWFKAQKKDYQRLIVAPTKGFVIDLGEALRERISDAIVSEPKTNGSIAPINNDLRFSRDKSPYKDHLLLKFWEGANKKTAPTLYVRIAPTGIGFATGAVFADVVKWRSQVASPFGADLARALAKLIRATGAEVVEEGLKRVPAPHPADHPRADLLRHKMIQVRWEEKLPTALHGPGFVDWCSKRLIRTAKVHEWLVAALESG
jgi:uncharacterized protein (TIGR02453 family)